ncbi:hypothetical protein B5X24_HaOG207021 [Helicoverpa armigera]|uniref:Uncharacterized protein n=1 Tax=Helicoverpa armigera TaxID=29058 RepID=A0A2W1BIQ5_HELAM|nr:hypothetical protein B5X24_HaOG207021 [Helicoverpa armigera]
MCKAEIKLGVSPKRSHDLKCPYSPLWVVSEASEMLSISKQRISYPAVVVIPPPVGRQNLVHFSAECTTGRPLSTAPPTLLILKNPISRNRCLRNRTNLESD